MWRFNLLNYYKFKIFFDSISKFLKFFLSIVSIFLLISCSSNNKNNEFIKKEIIPLEILYKKAYENYELGDYNESIRLFDLVEKDYSYSEWAPKALLMKSFLYYDAARYIDALSNLQRFKKRFSGHANIDYAEYLIAMCLFEQINFASLTQENTSLALKQFNKILAEYPNSDYEIDIKFKIDLLNEQFAAKEMYIARYYIKKEKWLPAIYRLNNIVKNYQQTIYIEEALHRLVEVNYKLGNIASAKKYATVLGYNYNDSDWYKKTYKIVEDKNFVIENSNHNKSFIEKFKKLIKLN